MCIGLVPIKNRLWHLSLWFLLQMEPFLCISEFQSVSLKHNRWCSVIQIVS